MGQSVTQTGLAARGNVTDPLAPFLAPNGTAFSLRITRFVAGPGWEEFMLAASLDRAKLRILRCLSQHIHTSIHEDINVCPWWPSAVESLWLVE